MNNMRPNYNPNMKRGRGRGRHNKPQHNNSNRTLESNGPDIKVRGNAHHIHEKYLQLSRDANSSGDRVMAENYLQHAEHYYRLIVDTHGSFQQQNQGGQPYANDGMNGRGQPQQQPGQPQSGEQPNSFQGLPGPSFPGDAADGGQGEDDGNN